MIELLGLVIVGALACTTYQLGYMNGYSRGFRDAAPKAKP